MPYYGFVEILNKKLDDLKRYADNRPLILGGIASSGGGIAGRPTGYIGHLPQSRVTYDKLEASLSGTDAGSPSLLDNLNHIRYRLTDLESGSTVNLDDLGDVVIATPASGEVLKYNGSNWINAVVSGVGGATNLDGLTDVVVSNPASGEFLKFTGSIWVNSDVIASGVSYDNSGSGLTATNVQSAIDELTGGMTPITYTGNSIVTTTGSYQSGNIDSVSTIDDADAYVVDEVTGTPGFNIGITYTGITEIINNVLINVKYSGALGHTIYLQLYNNDTTTWDNIIQIGESTAFELYTSDIINGSKYVDGSNEVDLRFYHSSAGNITHSIEIDYAVLRHTIGGGGVTDHGNLSGLADDDHTQYLLVDGTRVMASGLDMGGYSISNVDLIDGVDISAHVADTSIHFDELDELSNVIISTPASGEVLKYNGTNWINAVASGVGGATDLDSLTDVVIITPASGDVIRYNGTNWVNATISGTSAGHVIMYQGLAKTQRDTLNFMGDVVVLDNSDTLRTDVMIPTHIFNEDITPQITISGISTFTTSGLIMDGTLQLYYNGLRQRPSYFTVYSGSYFNTTFTASQPDEIVVDYLIDMIATNVPPTYPTLESFTYYNSGGGTVASYNIDKPTGVSVGDLLILFCSNDDSASSDPQFPAPAGWTKIYERGGPIPDVHTAAFWKIVDGTEGVQFEVDPVTSLRNVAWCLHITSPYGFPANPVDVYDSYQHSGASVFDITTITPTKNLTLCLVSLGLDHGDTSFSFTDGYWTKLDEQVQIDASDVSGVVGYYNKEFAGVAPQAQITSTTSNGSTAIILAVYADNQ